MASKTLADIAEIVMGQSPPGSTVSANGDTPLLNGPTAFGPSHPFPTKFTTHGRRFAKPGDVLFCVRGSTTGRMNWANQIYAIGRGIAAIRHKSEPALQPLIRAVLECKLPELLIQAAGSVFPNVSTRQLANIKWPDISLTQQRSIARILGTLDDKIELNRQMNETLEETAKTLFKSWFIDFDPVRAKQEDRQPLLPAHIADLFPGRLADSELGPIPEGWRIGRLSELAEHLRDTVDPRKLPQTIFSHFSIPAFDSGQIPIREQGSSIKSQKTVVRPGVLLISKLNPTTERVWLIDMRHNEQAICSTEFLVLLPESPSNLSYMYCLACSMPFRESLVSLVTGTSKSHQRAPVKAILSMKILAPPKHIITAFDDHVRPVLRRILTTRSESAYLADSRQHLLPKLISGILM